jgi:hypothetical protein
LPNPSPCYRWYWQALGFLVVFSAVEVRVREVKAVAPLEVDFVDFSGPKSA